MVRVTHGLYCRNSCPLETLGSLGCQHLPEDWIQCSNSTRPRGAYSFLIELTTALVKGDEAGVEDADMAENRRTGTRIING